MNKYFRIISLQVVMLVITYTNSYSMENSELHRDIEGNNHHIIDINEDVENNNKNVKNNQNKNNISNKNSIDNDTLNFTKNKKKRTIDLDSDNVDINNNQYSIPNIKYSTRITTWEQWTKTANFEAIDINGIEYNNICNFCKEHKLYSLKNGIDCFLLNIYLLANSIIDCYFDNQNNNAFHKKFSQQTFFHVGKYDYEIVSNYFQLGNISTLEEITKNWNKQNQRINIEEYGSIASGQLMLKKIVSTIRKIQQKLNTQKYLNNNDINNIPSDTTVIKIMDGFSFISNQLVQLTHDVLFAINNKIDEYKNISNEQLYKEFREYLINKITLPCINTINEALNDCIYNNNLTFNNIALSNENSVLEFFCENIREKWSEFLIYSKCSLIFYFSNLGEILYNQHQKFFNTFYEKLTILKKNYKNIDYNPITEFFSIFETEPYVIDNFDINLNYYYYYYGSEIMRYITNNTQNTNIINMANNYSNALLRQIENVILRLKYSLNTCDDSLLNNIDHDNNQLINKLIKELITELENIKNEVPNINYNINYIDDIKQLFAKYEIKPKDGGTYDITVRDIQNYDADGINIYKKV